MKKAMGLFAILMIAMSVVGFAYAHWSGKISIIGTVKMGTLTFGFTNITGTGEGKWNVTDNTIIPEPKPWVCNATWLRSGYFKDVHTNKSVYKSLVVWIADAYPEFVAWCNVTLDNAGTIPLDVTMYCVLVNSTDGLTYHWEDDVIVGRDENGTAVINIWFAPMFFGQIDPCQSKDTSIVVHIKEAALPCHTYKFTIWIHASQWN